MKNFLKQFGTTQQELELAQTLAESNQYLASETEAGTDVGFEYKGQFISNIFLDPTERFALTLEEAVSYYGADNVRKYYHDILNNTTVLKASLDGLKAKEKNDEERNS